MRCVEGSGRATRPCRALLVPHPTLFAMAPSSPPPTPSSILAAGATNARSEDDTRSGRSLERAVILVTDQIPSGSVGRPELAHRAIPRLSNRPATDRSTDPTLVVLARPGAVRSGRAFNGGQLHGKCHIIGCHGRNPCSELLPERRALRQTEGMPSPPPPPPPPNRDFSLDELLRLARLPFRDPGALRRWVFGIVATVVPVIGWLALAGYRIRVLRAALRQEPVTLPEWNDLGELFGDGFRVLLVTLAFALPAAVARILGHFTGDLLTLVSSLLGIAAFAFLPAALLGLATGRFAAAFDFESHIRQIRRHTALYVQLVLAVAVVFWLLELVVGVTLLLAPLAAFWGFAFEASLTGAAGRRMGIRPAPSGPLSFSTP